MPMGLTLMCNNTQSSCCAHRRVRISAFWWKWNLWRQEEGICFIPRGGLDECFRDSPSTFHFYLKSIGLEVDADGRSAEILYCTCTLPHNVQITYINFQNKTLSGHEIMGKKSPAGWSRICCCSLEFSFPVTACPECIIPLIPQQYCFSFKNHNSYFFLSISSYWRSCNCFIFIDWYGICFLFF